jgi:AraC-like DNA-binding protein
LIRGNRSLTCNYVLFRIFCQTTGGHVLHKSAKASSARDLAPVIAGGAGEYRERAVLPALRQHFARAWFQVGPAGTAGKLALVPDGCADLVWCRGAVHVAGPDRGLKIEFVPPGASVIGLQFQPGAAFRWLGTPASEIVDSRISLELFWGAHGRRLSQWIAEARSPNAIARRLELALTRRLPSVIPADPLPLAIFSAVRNRREYAVPITRQLSADLGLSERTLRRRCHEAFGYGPKTLDRVLRFQRFLQLARASGIDPTADLASDAGYSDQSHLAREARIYAGLTPGALRAQLRP